MTGHEGEAVLVFQAGGRRLAVPASDLVGVAPAELLLLPLAEPAHLGLMRHQETLFPVFDPLGLLEIGRVRSSAQLVVLLDTGGVALGLSCQRVEGSGSLEGPLEPVPGGVEGRVAGWPAVRLDLAAAVSQRLAGR
jgi:chemotaxis signal transduction protein